MSSKNAVLKRLKSLLKKQSSQAQQDGFGTELTKLSALVDQSLATEANALAVESDSQVWSIAEKIEDTELRLDSALKRLEQVKIPKFIMDAD